MATAGEDPQLELWRPDVSSPESKDWTAYFVPGTPASNQVVPLPVDGEVSWNASRSPFSVAIPLADPADTLIVDWGTIRQTVRIAGGWFEGDTLFGQSCTAHQAERLLAYAAEHWWSQDDAMLTLIWRSGISGGAWVNERVYTGVIHSLDIKERSGAVDRYEFSLVFLVGAAQS